MYVEVTFISNAIRIAERDIYVCGVNAFPIAVEWLC